jgi:hypothetical protein
MVAGQGIETTRSNWVFDEAVEHLEKSYPSIVDPSGE